MKTTSFAVSAVPLLFLASAVLAQNQRVVPGVNPNHYQEQQYQHPPAPQYQQQQHQQPQQHYQQPQQQQQNYQQPPQQQQQHHQQHQQYQQPQQVNQQQQPHQQQQQQQQHHQQQHHDHHNQILAGNVQEEKAHIAEHLDVPLDTSKMSEQELQFHYFKMHDADNNNKLDGCELIKSLIHWHEQGSKEQHNHDHSQPAVEEKIFTDEELLTLIDPILTMDDYSQDGFIDYPEFVRAQQKAAQANAREADQKLQQQQHQAPQP